MKTKLIAAFIVVLFSTGLVSLGNAKKTVNLGLIYTHQKDPVSETWLTDMWYEDALDRVAAARAAWDIVQTPTTENLAEYTKNTLLGLLDTTMNKDMLYPFGEKNSLSSVAALYDEITAEPIIMDDFAVSVEPAGTIGGARTDHWVLVLDPLDDMGPKFILDRYTTATMSEVTDEWSVQRRHPVLDKFIDEKVYYSIDTYSDPSAEFDAWDEILDPVIETCFWNFDYVMLGEIAVGPFSAQAALDYAVYSIPDGYVGSSCSGYTERSCPASLDVGIGYMSKCVFSDFEPGVGYNTITTFMVGYERM